MPDIDKSIIASLVPENPTIIDIGAYDGKDALELAELCNGEVHVFECDPRAIELLKARKDDRLIIWQYAISSHHGFCMLNQSHSDKRVKQSASSIREPKKHKKIFPDVKFRRKVKVECTTLDLWHTNVLAGRTIDFIWCDINGAEADFILGAFRALQSTRYLYIEFCEVELYERCLNRERMCKALPGFEVVSEHNFEGNFGNLLFKNKNEKLWQTSAQ